MCLCVSTHTHTHTRDILVLPFKRGVGYPSALPFSAYVLSDSLNSLFLPMPKLGILNSHSYAARGDAGIPLEAASFDPFTRDRGAAAAGEEISGVGGDLPVMCIMALFSRVPWGKSEAF